MRPGPEMNQLAAAMDAPAAPVAPTLKDAGADEILTMLDEVEGL